MWEAQKEEILSLRSIYCGPEECSLVCPHSFKQLEECSLGPISLVIKLNIPVKPGCLEESCVELSTTFELDESYPEEAPVIKLSSDGLDLGCIINLQEKAVVYARSLRPEPSLFSVLEWLKDSIYETDPSCFILKQHTSDGEYTKTLKQPLSSSFQSKSTTSHSAMYTRTNHETTVEYSVCIAKIDHMRNEQKYFKILKSWAKELSVSGRLLNCGRHSVYVLLIGSSGNLSEFLRRWKTQNTDVDSQGKPCKEKLISTLCQQLLNDFLPQWHSSVGCLELFHISKAELVSHFDGMEELFTKTQDLWSIALDERDRNEEERKKSFEAQGKSEGETTIFFVGSQNAGKTTIVLRFLEREEPPKPTTALEYTYGRRSRGANIAKDVTHIWELGGGTFLSRLVDMPITASNISNLSVILVLDLSKPEELWNTLEVFVKQIRQRTTHILAELKATNPGLASKLKQRTWRKFGEDHPDKDLLDPLPIPLAIIGTKYDIFQDFDPERKKIICKTLRFVAHTNGASLHFFSTRSDGLVNRTKQLIGHLAFGSALSRIMSMDYTKPLLVPAGSDALGQIGVPSLSSGDLGKINAKNPLELWKQAYCGFYPQVSTQPEIAEDPCKDPKYLEPTVDSMRAQKDEELERYRRECDRKARELARQREQNRTRTVK